MSRHSGPLFRSLLVLGLGALASPALSRAQHDCVPYPPTETGETLGGVWEDSEEHDVYQFTVPDEPGGGVVTVELVVPAPAVPWLNLWVEPSGATISAGGAAEPNQQQIVLVFEAAGGITYGLEVYQVFEAPPGDHPLSYELSWSWESRVDCYEPNDGQPSSWPDPSATARTVPFEQVLEAYHLAGLVSSGVAAGDARNYDWFHFSLAVFTEVSIGTLQVPADQSVKLVVYGEDGLAEVEGPNPTPGGLSSIGPTQLPPGNWYLAIRPVSRGLSNARTSAGDPYPDHFDVPYRFVLTTEPLDVECGFRSIFCDGFESGNTLSWDVP